LFQTIALIGAVLNISKPPYGVESSYYFLRMPSWGLQKFLRIDFLTWKALNWWMSAQRYKN